MIAGVSDRKAFVSIARPRAGTIPGHRTQLEVPGRFGLPTLKTAGSNVTLIGARRVTGTVAQNTSVPGPRPERRSRNDGAFTKGWLGVQSHGKERLRSNP